MGRTKKITGYIQIVLGVLLILAVIFAHKPLAQDAREQQRGEEGFEGWINYAESKNITFDSKEKVEMTMDLYSTMINNLYILRATLAVILVLSVMMILQGVANADFSSGRKKRK